MALTWIGDLGLTQYIYENTPEPPILRKLHVDTFVLTTSFDTSKGQKVHLNLDFKSRRYDRPGSPRWEAETHR